jgi:hypothetical protein
MTFQTDMPVVRIAFDLDMPLAPAMIRMFNSLSQNSQFEVFLLARDETTVRHVERWGFWAKIKHLHITDEKQKFCVDNKIDVLVGPGSLFLHQ